MNMVYLRFYEELNFFLPKEIQKKEFSHKISRGQTVKDMIESEGVPHVEVDLVLVNGKSVDFRYKIQPGEHISVYPVFERLDISDVMRLRPFPLRQPKFVLDVHLHKLAVKMRLLGLDTDYQPNRDDPELARISSEENRILLTRDRGLLMRKIITHGLYVRGTDPKKQIKEIIGALDLYKWLKPFSRCTNCNGNLYEVETNSNEYTALKNELPRGITEKYQEFFRCDTCKQIYWEGSHIGKIREWLKEIGIIWK